MEPEAGGVRRVELFLAIPRYKLEESHRVVTLVFSVQMNADIALLCDVKIRNAFEQCETLEKEVASVRLKSGIAQVDAKFFDTKDSKPAIYTMTDSIVEEIGCERTKGVTYLYFQLKRALRETPNIAKFVGDHYCTALFVEFSRTKPAQPRKLELHSNGDVR